MTITALRRRLAQERTGCVSILDHCLAAIDAREKDIHAWVIVDRDDARRQAADLDTELSAGYCRGPLHGVPVGIKDIIDVKGLPTAAGYQAWRDRVAATDANLVQRLRQAGAVILGKTETTQFASFDPAPTCNPHDLCRTPGGSSSGSAAAVAAGMCLGAVGTQTGGSITRPAAFCGVCGFKPTFGALPFDGIVPFAPSLDHAGPFAKCIADIACMSDALYGNSDGCFAAAATGTDRPPDLLRLPHLFDAHADADAAAAVNRCAEIFEHAGASVFELPTPPIFADIIAMHTLIMDFEAAQYHRERFSNDPSSYGPNIADQVRHGLTISEEDYTAALRVMGDAQRAATILFADCDAWLAPATPGPAPNRTTTGNPVMNAPASFLHLPTINMPARMAVDGLPLGIQLLGRKNADNELIAVACWAEQRLDDVGRP